MGLSCFEEDKSTNSTKDYGFDLVEYTEKQKKIFVPQILQKKVKTYLINILITNLLKKLIKKQKNMKVS